MNNYFIYALGFLAQILFFLRTIAQWFKSEQESEVTSPVVYWQISLVGSILMLTYGILRNDFAIVIGQFLVYAIYIRNLQLKKAWERMYLLSKILAITIPLVYLGWLVFSGNFNSIFKNEDVSGNYSSTYFYLTFFLPMDLFGKRKGIFIAPWFLDY